LREDYSKILENHDYEELFIPLFQAKKIPQEEFQILFEVIGWKLKEDILQPQNFFLDLFRFVLGDWYIFHFEIFHK